LPKTDPDYVPVHSEGEIRDSSYHDGMVWSWLLGPYVDALMKVYGAREKAQEIINNFKYHLNEACIGSISEMFEAGLPHHPRGCIAQASSVAEMLRVIKDYQLFDIRMVKKEMKTEVAEV
jgi:glycogen debranching enzyme